MTELQKKMKDESNTIMALSTFLMDVENGCINEDDGYGDLFLKSTGELLDESPFDMLDIPKEDLRKYVVVWYNK
ncbi:MAG: hypothetical protein ACRCX2_19010 [Paraclostridium sp.]